MFACMFIVSLPRFDVLNHLKNAKVKLWLGRQYQEWTGLSESLLWNSDTNANACEVQRNCLFYGRGWVCGGFPCWLADEKNQSPQLAALPRGQNPQVARQTKGNRGGGARGLQPTVRPRGDQGGQGSSQGRLQSEIPLLVERLLPLKSFYGKHNIPILQYLSLWCTRCMKLNHFQDSLSNIRCVNLLFKFSTPKIEVIVPLDDTSPRILGAVFNNCQALAL